MSKKTRKKSSKTVAKKTAQKAPTAKPARDSAKAPAKKPAAKAGKAVAKKSAKTTQSASAKASHKPTSKPLKSDQSASPKSAPVEGGKAPGFELPRDGGGTVSLADYAGKKLVLFFYPRADTPGCTREAIDFTRLKSALPRTAPKSWVSPPTPSRHKNPLETNMSSPFLSFQMSSMRCWRPMVPGAKNPCMAGLSLG
jgi:hypothetical protein